MTSVGLAATGYPLLSQQQAACLTMSKTHSAMNSRTWSQSVTSAKATPSSSMRPHVEISRLTEIFMAGKTTPCLRFTTRPLPLWGHGICDGGFIDPCVSGKSLMRASTALNASVKTTAMSQHAGNSSLLQTLNEFYREWHCVPRGLAILRGFETACGRCPSSFRRCRKIDLA